MKIGIIGCGNMGGAVAMAVAKAAASNGHRFLLANRTKDKAVALVDKINTAAGKQIAACSDNAAAAACDIVFLAVKPYQLEAVIGTLKENLREDALLISMIGSSALKELRAMTGTERIIRIMPNTPVAVGAGVTLWCAADGVGENDLALFNDLMKCTGILHNVDEDHFEAVTPITGCGPAYAAMFADAMADACVSLGVKKDEAVRYAAEMMLGTAKLMLETGKHPVALKDEVCSPKGTTVKGVIALEREGFRASVIDAILTAAGRN